jgi:hypothetical protein
MKAWGLHRRKARMALTERASVVVAAGRFQIFFGSNSWKPSLLKA